MLPDTEAHAVVTAPSVPFYWFEAKPHHPECTTDRISPALFPAGEQRLCGGCGGPIGGPALKLNKSRKVAVNADQA
jgi:hypothetical protein